MKVLSLSNLCILGALVLGLTVLWANVTPTTYGADSITGGDWWPYTGNHCCWDEALDNCNNGAALGFSGCNSHPLWILLVSGPYTGSPVPPPVCSGPGLCIWVCDSSCNEP